MTFAVLCPGQGAQHAAMLDPACRYPEGLRAVEQAGASLGEDPRAWLTDGEAIFSNAIAQPLICIAQFALWATLRAALPRPTAAAGYSVGELACYGVCDALDAGELALLARSRAVAMDRAAADRPGGVVAVRGLSRPALLRDCAGLEAFIAIGIADDAFVVGGTDAALTVVKDRCGRAGAQVTDLRIGRTRRCLHRRSRRFNRHSNDRAFARRCSRSSRALTLPSSPRASVRSRRFRARSRRRWNGRNASTRSTSAAAASFSSSVPAVR